MKLFTIPNLMTLGNLLCGCLGILSVLNGNPVAASVFTLIALILDFGDGFIARLLNQASPIGKELDSLADVVTFGVLPSFLLYYYVNPAVGQPWAYVTFIVALFSALRLAKFNIDTRQSDSFIGVPTPANAMVVAALPLIEQYQAAYFPLITQPVVLIVYAVVMSVLLVAELPLFALKFKNFSWQSNQIKYIFLILSVILLLLFRYIGVPLVIFLYICLSFLERQQTKQ